jgi:glycine dehydrogenase
MPIKKNRKKILIPRSAHGTNFASAAIANYIPLTIEHNKDGTIDLEHLYKLIEKNKDDIVGIMMTYPSTYGFFDGNTQKAIDMVKSINGYVYLDGANMNAWVGQLKPTDMNFDIMHINLHKTFAIPHGGGGPGVGCLLWNTKSSLQALERVSSSGYGNGIANLISNNYIAKNKTNFDKISKKAVDNANYIVKRLEDHFSIPYRNKHNQVAHELIINLKKEIADTGVTEVDIAKRLIDYSLHAPTMSWPVAQCLMIEPTETENIENLDYLCDALIQIKHEMYNSPDILKKAPYTLDTVIEKSLPKHYYYPLGEKTQLRKYWGHCGRIDDLHGDRTLMSKFTLRKP